MIFSRYLGVSAVVRLCGGLLVLMVLSSAAPLHAQNTSTDSCPVGGAPSSGARGDGNDIQCRINNILSRHQTLITNLQTKLNNCNKSAPNNHCDLIQDHLNRAQAAQNRATRANGRLKGSDYSDLNTVRKAKCTGKNTDCASGNGTVTGGDTDSGVGSDLADQLDDASTGLDKANGLLSGPPPSSPANIASASTFEALYDYTTDPDYPAWLHVGDDPKATIPTTFALKMAAGVAEGVEVIAEDACKQEAVVLGEGGNTSLACMALSIAAVALKSSAELVEFVDADTAAWDAHGAYKRAENINNNLGQVQSAVGNTQTQITNLQNQVTALQNQLQTLANTINEKFFVVNDTQKQLLQLLLVPDGQRTIPASLLSCTGDKSTPNPCPPVGLSCSSATGQCSFNK